MIPDALDRSITDETGCLRKRVVQRFVALALRTVAADRGDFVFRALKTLRGEFARGADDQNSY